MAWTKEISVHRGLLWSHGRHCIVFESREDFFDGFVKPKINPNSEINDDDRE
jgi:hypothetical protein